MRWFNQIEFAHTEYFWLLLLLPIILFVDLIKESNFQSKLSMSTVQQLPVGSYFVHHITKLIKLLAFGMLVCALARPQLPLSWKNIKTEGIDIMVALDVSGSMQAMDFKPNRLEASKDVAVEFIGKRPNDRIGLVVYAGESFTQCPLTTDHAVVMNLFKDIEYGMIEDGTAIGMGLANAVNRLKESDAKSRVVILLTDGENTTGSIPPLTAADIAKQFDVRVYTIGVGTEGMAPFPATDMFGRKTTQDMPVKIDEKTLKEIAGKTGGKYFRATDKDRLGEIYTEIDELEKTIIEQTEFEEKDEQYYWFGIASLILFVLGFISEKVIFKSIV